MDNQKQIEEMTKDLKEEKLYALINKTSYMRSAENLYELGYRKIPENAVVLTDEEIYEELNACKVAMIVHDDDGEKYVSLDDYNEYTKRLGKIASQRKARIEQLEKLLDDRCDHCIERERKETAEKFAERVKIAFYYEFDELIPSIMADKIDEICKEITEGKV